MSIEVTSKRYARPVQNGSIDADQINMDRKYGLVLGQGRSGTNWITACVDASPTTFCRNEPNECVPSIMDPLTNHWRIGADGAALSQWWEKLAQQTAIHMGERDHRLDHPKTFVHPLAQRLGLAQLSARPRFRSVASRVLWSWADGEWKMPRWVGDLSDPNIFAVLKIVQAYNWATWVLEHRPDVPVVHVVRHPGGRHESFLRRYVAFTDVEQTRKSKVAQLATLAPDKGLTERMGPVDELTLAEAETWFGVYQMETFEQRAESSPRYLRVVYEEMVRNPGDSVEQIFDHFELRLTSQIRARIEEASSTSVFGPQDRGAAERIHGWRDRLAPETIDQIERILATSPVATWWDDTPATEHTAA